MNFFKGSNKRYSNLIKLLVVFVFVFNLTSPHTYAQTDVVAKVKDFFANLKNLAETAKGLYCDTEGSFYKANRDQAPMVGLTRFTLDTQDASMLATIPWVFGTGLNNFVHCIPIAIYGISVGADVIKDASSLACGASYAPPSTCGLIIDGITYDESGKPTYANGSITEGGLLGLSNSLMKVVYDPPVLMDNRYFVMKQVEKVPFVGTAMAATSTYSHAGYVTYVYRAWVFIRNLCFSVLAIIMLVVGVMLINRSKISPQAVISVEYALPKIVIAVVLIAFSYPLGAFMYDLSRGLAPAIITAFREINITSNDDMQGYLVEVGNTGTKTFSITRIIGSLVFHIFTLAGSTIFMIIVGIIGAVVVIFQIFIIIYKYFAYSIKMLMEIVLSPATFVISAVPGNDDRVANWFKKMLGYVLIIVILNVGPFFVLFVSLQILIGVIDAGANAVALDAGGSALVGLAGASAHGAEGILFAEVAFMAGLAMVLKMPSQIEEALTGKKKR
jgi:hypothetical protein